MPGFDEDTEFPVLHTARELRVFFRRAAPFIDDKPRRARFEPLDIAGRLGRFGALVASAGDPETAVREIVGEMLRGADPVDDGPSLVILPNGWVAMPRPPATRDDAPLRVAVYPPDDEEDDADPIVAAACAVLLGLRDLFDADDDPPGPDDPPLETGEWDPGVGAFLGGAALLAAFAERLAEEAEAAPEPPRGGRGILGAQLRWLTDRRDQRGRAAPAPPAPRARRPRDIDLHDHVINLRFGTLSDSGALETRPEDIDAMVGKAVAFLAADPSRKLMVYAHGGLVSEGDGRDYAATTAGWWYENGVYPIFCVWESDATTTIMGLLAQWFGLQRDRGFEDKKDAAIESIVNRLGVPVWDGMKQSATRASAPGGGLALFTKSLVAALKPIAKEKRPPLHLVGHSAGAILHLRFLDLLKSAGLSVGSLQFLAPAATAALTREALARNPVPKCRVYAMTDAAERADPTTAPYGKSLLYLVRGGFERVPGTPITGLQKDLAADRALVETIAAGRPTREAFVFSPTADGAAARLSSRSVTHGGFDNDRASMESVMWFIRDGGPLTPFPKAGTVSRGARGAAEMLPEAARSYLALVAEPPAPVSRSAASGLDRPWAAARGATSRLLSVGIDKYAVGKRLAGCENDSRRWRERLSARSGWDVAPTDGISWTRQAIIDELGRFVASGKSGDLLVWHYSGHGMEVAADDPASEPNEADQAIVGSNADQSDAALARHALVDNDIYDMLQKVADGVRLYVFFDCCHSGTATRYYTPGTPRTLGRIRVRGYRPGLRPLVGSYFDDNAAYSAARHVLFSACSPVQLASEDGPGEIQGAFTRAVWDVLDTAPSGLTNRTFCDKIRATLLARGNDQVPGVYCPEGRRDEAFPL